MKTSPNRTYSELIQIPDYVERFKYLKLNGFVGVDTFGFDRYVNQRFYSSREWKTIRDRVIIRDNGCDMAFPNHEIFGRVYIHHINPISIKDIDDASDILLNPEYLICVSHETHNAIHYGDEELLEKPLIDRARNDTCPWKK